MNQALVVRCEKLRSSVKITTRSFIQPYPRGWARCTRRSRSGARRQRGQGGARRPAPAARRRPPRWRCACDAASASALSAAHSASTSERATRTAIVAAPPTASSAARASSEIRWRLDAPRHPKIFVGDVHASRQPPRRGRRRGSVAATGVVGGAVGRAERALRVVGAAERLEELATQQMELGLVAQRAFGEGGVALLRLAPCSARSSSAAVLSATTSAAASPTRAGDDVRRRGGDLRVRVAAAHAHVVRAHLQRTAAEIDARLRQHHVEVGGARLAVIRLGVGRARSNRSCASSNSWSSVNATFSATPCATRGSNRSYTQSQPARAQHPSVLVPAVDAAATRGLHGIPGRFSIDLTSRVRRLTSLGTC